MTLQLRGGEGASGGLQVSPMRLIEASRNRAVRPRHRCVVVVGVIPRSWPSIPGPGSASADGSRLNDEITPKPGDLGGV